MTQLTDAGGSTQSCYNRFGRLVRKTQTTNGKTFIVRYASKAGQLSSVTYPEGSVVDYVRDGQGRATEVGLTPSAGPSASDPADPGQLCPLRPGHLLGHWQWPQPAAHAQPQLPARHDPRQRCGRASLHYGFDAVGNLD